MFEWLGTGTFVGLPDGSGKGATMTLEGMTRVLVAADGLVVDYRDYLDQKGTIDQVDAALAGPGTSTATT